MNAHGIGRRVHPGHLDINALVEGGGMTTKAEDGPAIMIPVKVRHYETAADMCQARAFYWPGRNAAKGEAR